MPTRDRKGKRLPEYTEAVRRDWMQAEAHKHLHKELERRAGAGLKAIRDRELWREKYESLEECIAHAVRITPQVAQALIRRADNARGSCKREA